MSLRRLERRPPNSEVSAFRGYFRARSALWGTYWLRDGGEGVAGAIGADIVRRGRVEPVSPFFFPSTIYRAGELPRCRMNADCRSRCALQLISSWEESRKLFPLLFFSCGRSSISSLAPLSPRPPLLPLSESSVSLTSLSLEFRRGSSGRNADIFTRNHLVLVQNQGEMLKSGRLAVPYKGIADCATRTYADEGMISCKFFSSQPHILILTSFVSLERKHRQRHPILPYSSPQLRLQGLLQIPLLLHSSQGRLRHVDGR